MAEKADKKEGEGTEKVSFLKSRKGVIIIASSVAVVVVLGVVGALLAFGAKEEPASQDQQAKVEQLAPEAAAVVVSNLQPEWYGEELELEEDDEPLGAMFPFDTFVLNVKGDRFVRLQIQVEFSSRDIPARFLSRLVPIRDAMITLITSKKSEDLLTEQGKLNLKVEIKGVINELLRSAVVSKVYFTQFVVQ